jgi:hypothetical protein
MKPDRDNGLDRLFEKARTVNPDVFGVEAGLETRVLARIRAERERRVGILDWSWRLVPAFSAIVVALGVWYYASIPSYSVDMHTAFAADYEDTLALNLINGE